jgi:hypothetical protein
MRLLAVPISSTAASARQGHLSANGPPPRTRRPARPDPPVEHCLRHDHRIVERAYMHPEGDIADHPAALLRAQSPIDGLLDQLILDPPTCSVRASGFPFLLSVSSAGPLASVNSVNSSLMIYHSWGSGDTRRRLSFREPNA